MGQPLTNENPLIVNNDEYKKRNSNLSEQTAVCRD